MTTFTPDDKPQRCGTSRISSELSKPRHFHVNDIWYAGGMKPIPKLIAVAAKAQFFLIGRAIVRGISQQTFELLLQEWLKINTPLLRERGLAGKDLTQAVNVLVETCLAGFDREEQSKISARMKTLRASMN